MDDHTKSSRSYFTEAARAAAAEAKRLKRENSVPRDTPAVFVVRVPPANKMFGWEIRRFGSLVLRRGATQFSTAAEARVAGEAALAELAIVADHDRVAMAAVASSGGEAIPYDWTRSLTGPIFPI